MITYSGAVYPHQLDHMGHMNVQWYVAKFDEGTWRIFAQLGLTPDYMRAKHCGMAAVEQTIRYKAEVMAGDLLVVNSEVLELREKVIRLKHRMDRVGTEGEVASCEIVAVHLDRTTRRSRDIPGFVREAVRTMGTANDGLGQINLDPDAGVR